MLRLEDLSRKECRSPLGVRAWLSDYSLHRVDSKVENDTSYTKTTKQQLTQGN